MRLLRGGKIHTMASGRVVEAIAFDATGIVAVGDEQAVRARVGADVELVDLAGRAVVPGFIDVHHHVSSAVLYRRALDCGPSVVRSIRQLVGLLRRRDASMPPDAWLVAYGFDPLFLSEGRAPTRHDLDAISTERPILLMHALYHEAVVNSVGLASCGIGRTTPSPPAGHIVRDRHGDPTGHLIETAIGAPSKLANDSLVRFSDGTLAQYFREYVAQLLRVGITRVTDAAVPPSALALYQSAFGSDGPPLPMSIMPVSEQGYLLPAFDELASDIYKRGTSVKQLTVGPAKLFFDGADKCAVQMTLGGAGAFAASALSASVRQWNTNPLRVLLSAGAALGGDLSLHTGNLFHTSESAKAVVRFAVEQGFPVAIHANGNEAVAQAVDAIEAVRSLHPDTPPPRIEHAVFCNDLLIKRMADLGIAVAAQPQFLELSPYEQIQTLPGVKTIPLRSLREAGVLVAGSSDAPVTGFNPLVAARFAALRRTPGGHAVCLDEALSTMETLELYTCNGARISGCFDETGSLEKGKRADLVILSEDPGNLAPEELDRIAVEETVVGGETLYLRQRTAT